MPRDTIHAVKVIKTPERPEPPNAARLKLRTTAENTSAPMNIKQVRIVPGEEQEKRKAKVQKTTLPEPLRATDATRGLGLLKEGFEIGRQAGERNELSRQKSFAPKLHLPKVQSKSIAPSAGYFPSILKFVHIINTGPCHRSAGKSQARNRNVRARVGAKKLK
jgi:hypothetical protein